MQLPPRVVLAPLVAATVALLVSGALAWLTWFQPGDPSSRTGVHTHTVVNRAGGYSVQVPHGLRASRAGAVTRVRDTARSLSVTVTPTTLAAPAATNKEVLRAMGTTYRSVMLTTSERLTVDRHPAVASYGRATSVKGVRLRFVLVAVRETSRSFAISAFARIDADPATVLPRVRAITSGFRAMR